jgi:hypothetical protein
VLAYCSGVFVVTLLQVLEGKEAARAVRDLEDYNGDSGIATGQCILLLVLSYCCYISCNVMGCGALLQS